MRRLFVLLAVASLVVAFLPAAVGAAPSASAAGSYIVVLKSGDPGKTAAAHSRRYNASVKHVYRHALRGYAARMSATAAARIARNPRVAYVEPDGVVTATATQSNATWGLDRIDAPSGLDGAYNYNVTGAGVTAYIVDTGIRRTHSEFSGRVSTAYYDAFGGSGADCNGHGTHVAGTVGGEQWGVAKDVSLVAVRVLDCSGSGTWSGVIAGLDWVTANAVKPAVANMSLGGGASTSVDDAVRRTVASGVTVAVAAGNGNKAGKEQDACNYSPARVPEAITIGATTRYDSKTSWSNYGSCVDWFAPGAGITSAWYDSDESTNTIRGTSMAAPHTAGAAALYLEANPGASAQAVRDALYAETTKGVVTSSKTANNHLLYTGSLSSGGGTPPSNSAPTASNTSVTVQAGSTATITLTGQDAETCDLGFATADPAGGGTVGTLSGASCTSGTPNTDTATAQYTAPDDGSTADSFTFTVTDGSLTSAPATVSITVTQPSSGTDATANDDISNTQYGGRYNINHVDVAVSVTSNGAQLSGAGVAVTITRDGAHYWSGIGTTSSSGVVFSFKNTPTGSYTATVTGVTPPTGYVWDTSGDSTNWSKTR